MSDGTNQARAIFLQAIEFDSPEQQEQFVADACQDDAELRERVERLLTSHRQLGSFHDHTPADSPTVDHSIAEKPGTQIGHYKLLQLLGAGGMGEVYMAEQTEPVERRVAVKIIKAGMDTRQVVARFEAERQALAMMDHPNIAKVFDAGTTGTGRPYFAMEMVKGVPITQYCDEHRLDLHKRLALFEDVCHAVQHAHQKGVIHRDIKPSNVLVAEYDDLAVPKVIDFGVAKATQQRLTEKTMFTEVGTVIGTIEYMSPEQAKLNQLDIDTRSDIYSLGVLLYELLAGETPFDRKKLRDAALDEMLRIIREEEPSRPSIKLSTSESLPSIAANRHVQPRKLGMLIRGELDWIVMKSLEKDRSRRYETASEFADDVRRYMDNELVEARPPSFGYRVRKYAARNRRYAPLIMVLAASLLALVVFGTRDYRHSIQQNKLIVESAINSHIALASEYMSDEKHRQALVHLKDAESLLRQHSPSSDPRIRKVELALAGVYASSGNYRDAITLYEGMLEPYGQANRISRAKQIAQYLVTSHVSRARQLTEAAVSVNDLRESVAHGQRAVELSLEYDLYPSSAWLALVEAKYQQGDYRGALSRAETYLASGTGDFEYPFYLWFAILHSKLGESEIARDWFVVASSLWPGVQWRQEYQSLRDEAAELILGSPKATLITEALEEREQAFSRIMTKYRRCPNLRRSRAYRLFQLGKWDLAAQDFELACERTNYPSIDYDICRALMDLHQGRKESYRTIRQDLLERVKANSIRANHQKEPALALIFIEPDTIAPDTLVDLTNQSDVMAGVAQFRAGNYPAAASLLQSADTDAIGTYASLFLAMAYQELGKAPEAKALLQRVRTTIRESCALPGIPRPEPHASYFVTVLWCAPLAVLPEAEKFIEGELSLLGQAVITGDYALLASQEDWSSMVVDVPHLTLTNARE